MHGTSARERRDAAAIAHAIQQHRANGETVVVLRAGAAIHSFDHFVDAGRAAVAARELSWQHADEITHTEVLPPLSAAEAAAVRGRDQSEDRPVSFANADDYVARVGGWH